MVEFRSPFPWFGGKRRVADIIWSRLGSVDVYVEPFAGSLATMFANPNPGSTREIVNDLDGMVTNAWRSIQADPEGLKKYVDWPVSELDLHSRSTWCEENRTALEDRLRSDPHYYDLKMAGWWIWGMSTGIGDTFIAQKKAIPELGNRGIHRKSFDWDSEFEKLSERLREVRVACGDWTRVVKPSVTKRFGGVCGVFLDPPYAREDRHDTYAHESYSVAGDVETWCLENGNDSDLRIVLAGYEGDYNLPPSWEKHAWKAGGGLAAYGDGSAKTNRGLERLWFSPHCCSKKMGVLTHFVTGENQ